MFFNEINPFQIVSKAFETIDHTIKKTSHWKIIGLTSASVAIGTLFAANWVRRKNWNWEAQAKGLLRNIPNVNKKVEGELSKMETNLEKKFFLGADPDSILEAIPEKSWTTEQIMARLENVSGNARNGKNTGAYYIDNVEIDQLIQQVFHLSRRTNPLHLDLCPLIRQLEAEIVRMTLQLFMGDANTVGNVTSGGTDSIRHAVFTARERAKSLGLCADWEMVIPTTAHPAFAKAANEYGIQLIRTAVFPHGHPNAFQANIDAMRRAITSRTILVAGSMPPFPHGIPDDIDAISAMLEKVDARGFIGLHVDACLGGFVVPWMEQAGYGNDLQTRFGFDVNRVTSISADTHKYGYGEKGTSVVMYRNHHEWRKHQIFVETNWEGGIYATPTLPGSRSGKDIAALWAVMAYLGKRGYIEETKKIIQTTRKVITAIKEDIFFKEHLEIMGDPKLMVLAFCSKNSQNMNIYDLKDEMKKLDWYLSSLQKPAGIHFCITAVQANNDQFVNTFLADLKKCLHTVLQYSTERKGKSSDAVMYCTNETFGEKVFLPDIAREFWNISCRQKPVTFNL